VQGTSGFSLRKSWLTSILALADHSIEEFLIPSKVYLEAWNSYLFSMMVASLRTTPSWLLKHLPTIQLELLSNQIRKGSTDIFFSKKCSPRISSFLSQHGLTSHPESFSSSPELKLPQTLQNRTSPAQQASCRSRTPTATIYRKLR
jgi:hypothetical protein